MKFRHALILLGMASFGSLAAAQMQETPPPTSTEPTAPPPPAESAPPESAPPASAPPAAGTATAAPVSDTEVQQYATALVGINQVQQDTSVAEADKQQKMLAKVQEAGLAPQRFNEITQASQSDPTLQQRIQTAMASPAPASPPPPPGSR